MDRIQLYKLMGCMVHIKYTRPSLSVLQGVEGQTKGNDERGPGNEAI